MPTEPQCESALTADEFESILQCMVDTGVLRTCTPVMGAHAVSFRVCDGFDAMVNVNTDSGCMDAGIRLGAHGTNPYSSQKQIQAGVLGDAYLLRVKTKPEAMRLVTAVINRVRAVYAPVAQHGS